MRLRVFSSQVDDCMLCLYTGAKMVPIQTQATNKPKVRATSFICRHPAGNYCRRRVSYIRRPTYVIDRNVNCGVDIIGNLQTIATNSLFLLVNLKSRYGMRGGREGIVKIRSSVKNVEMKQ